MNGIINSGQKKYYSPFKHEDKFYFGGYFNLAMDNVDSVFAELGMLLKNKRYKFNEFITNMFPDNLSLVEYERYVKLISDYFPMASYLDDREKPRSERVTYFRTNLKGIINIVSNLRNFYTHHRHENIDISDEEFKVLNGIFEKTILTVKKKKIKSDKTKEILKEAIEKELDILCQQKLKFLQNCVQKIEEKRKEQKEKGEKVDKPFRFSDKKEDLIASVYNDAFEDYLDKKTNRLKESSKIEYEKSFPKRDEGDLEIPVSQKGVVFLLSLFLTKKEIQQFKARIKGYKGTILTSQEVTEKSIDYQHNSLRYMATHEIFSFLAFKGLKRKIRTSEINFDDKQDDEQDNNIPDEIPAYSKETLMMQMLDELSKVPNVVYKNLSEDLQKTFIEDWNEYFKENNSNVESVDEDLVIHPVIRKRYEDKFNYFAIRFLDEFAEFPTLRFQVYLGDYLHDSRSKNIIANREVKEKITVFGRLSELDNKKALFLKNIDTLSNEMKEKGNWKIFPNPSYDFPKENISKNDKTYTIEKSVLERGKLPLANKIGIKVS